MCAKSVPKKIPGKKCPQKYPKGPRTIWVARVTFVLVTLVQEKQNKVRLQTMKCWHSFGACGVETVKVESLEEKEEEREIYRN